MRSLHIAMKSSPRSALLEKAHTQQRRPNATKNKKINLLKKKEEWSIRAPWRILPLTRWLKIQEKRVREEWAQKYHARAVLWRLKREGPKRKDKCDGVREGLVGLAAGNHWWSPRESCCHRGRLELVIVKDEVEAEVSAGEIWRQLPLPSWLLLLSRFRRLFSLLPQ